MFRDVLNVVSCAALIGMLVLCGACEPHLPSSSDPEANHASGEPDGGASRSSQVYYRFGDALHVFDVDNSLFFLTDADYLGRVDGNYDSDIASSNAICSNEHYYCVAVGLLAVVPKGEIQQTEWSYNGISCSVVERVSQARVQIACQSSGRTYRILYSAVRGIEYYEQVGERGVRFELVGSRGLFAQPASQ